MLFALLVSALAQGAPVPDPFVLNTNPVVLYDNFDPSLPSICEGLPLGGPCSETLVGIYYPPGVGPKAFGYTNAPSPVFINLRGGNTNPLFPELYGWFVNNVHPYGFVGVDPNYAVVPPGEDYTYSEASVARLIQFLRHNAEWLNIDPERIFLFGRSFGGYLTFALGLRGDYADPTSPDPMLHHSSRPDFLLPFSAMTDLTCLSPAFQFDWLLNAYFPVSLAPGATTAQKLADSPLHWLHHPELFGRTETPPMFFGYHLGVLNPCGQITDPHDGYFGYQIRDALDDFVVEHNLPELGLRSKLQNTGDLWGYWAPMQPALEWCVKQLAPVPDLMYQPKPQGPIGPAGSVHTLRALGGLPGAFTHFFVAFTSGPVALPFCPNLQEGLHFPLYLGSDIADAEGRASFDVLVPPIAIGVPLVFHVADLDNCRVTQILPHTWTE